jgi:hypothetical protein
MILNFGRAASASTIRCVLALGLAAILLPVTLSAQHEDHGDIDLKSEVGKVSFANSGAPAAQSAFLRGLALLHNFQYPQAAESFRAAEKLDPSFAMAYWGEAMTYNHGIWKEQDSVAARALLARLGAGEEERLAKAPTAREKDYLRTLDVLYSTEGTKAGRDTAYAGAMQQVAQRYPDDADAQLFYALSLLSLPRTDSTYMRAATIAAKVMREHPQHPGALHYVIHAYDDPAHASLGLAAARAYSKVAINAPHAQHMTSHIFIALGMWDDVVAANEVALHTNEAERGAAAVAAAMCGHAGLWLHYAYLQQGRLADARKMMDGCRAGSATSPSMARGYASMRLRYLIDAPQAPAAIVAMPTVTPKAIGARFSLDYANALDAFKGGDAAGIASAADHLREIHNAFDASPDAKVSPEFGDDMRVEENQVRALSMLLSGHRSEAETLLRQTADEEDKLTFQFGPPAIEKPSRELLGEVLLADAKPADAVHEFELALKKTPGRSLTLMDLARARRAAGNESGANEALEQLAANWHRADADFPRLKQLHVSSANTTPVLSRDQLISFSVLPLPENLRAGAGVVELDAHAQPTELRKSSNGMVCTRFVAGEEDWDARCYHESFAPLFLRSRQLAADGMKGAAVTARIEDELKQGKLHLPDHPTAGYRLLGPAASYDPATGKTTDAMRFWQSIHMPFRTAADLGLPNETEFRGPQRQAMPYVMASGTWWAHVMIEHAPHH